MAEPLAAWTIPEAGFPARGAPADKLRFLARYAVLAPSSHNTQPWLFNLRDDAVDLVIDRTRGLPVADPEDRELTISCGAALFNLRVAARHFGYADVVEPFPDPADPDLLARVRLGEPVREGAEDRALFEAIPWRRTNRQPFEPRAVPPSLLQALERAVAAEGAWLQIVRGQATRDAVADLIAEGDRIQWDDPRFRRELASWIHPRRSGDGLPGYGFGVGPLIVRTFDLGNGQAAKDRELAAGSPVLAVLGTDEDTPAAWLAAGQALERLLLMARAGEVWASYLNQPIQVAALRPRLRDAIGRGGYPQVLLRMGYGPEPKPAPRRSLDDVLV